MRGFLKERPRPEPGSIPDLLGMFQHEVRFYREIAPRVGIRVPGCSDATETDDGFRLVLEDLSGWRQDGDPVEVACVLADLHHRWEGTAERRWPWLRRGGKAAEAIGELYDRSWANILQRSDLTPALRDLGTRFVEKVAEIERSEATAARRTLIHGDASLRNVRTSPTGVIALVDWEDVRSSNGAVDLAWLLVSSIEPRRWDEVIDAYSGDEVEFAVALPAAATQGILSFGASEPDTPEATGWITRLEALAQRLQD